MTTSSGAPEVERLARAIADTLRARPVFFIDLVREHRALPYRTLLLAWGLVRERHALDRTDDGRYRLGAAPPEAPGAPGPRRAAG
jgi:hypothetical protein